LGGQESNEDLVPVRRKKERGEGKEIRRQQGNRPEGGEKEKEKTRNSSICMKGEEGPWREK